MKKNLKEKVCKRCGEIKDISAMQRNTKSCKLCINTEGRMKKYGITKIEFFALKKQKLCSICGDEKKLVIDHCHSTGEIRGMICSQCNSGLGQFFDKTEFLIAAVKYLQFPPARNLLKQLREETPCPSPS